LLNADSERIIPPSDAGFKGGIVQSVLIIIHAPAYGSERMLSALRLATAIASQEIETVSLRLFMMSDAVTVGLPNQLSPESGCSLQQMLEELVRLGAQIKLCRTCAQARGVVDRELISGVAIGTLPELAEWTLTADKVISF
jgi:uncharacterized protein involved in oxidation of intracellular sulfur